MHIRLKEENGIVEVSYHDNNTKNKRAIRTEKHATPKNKADKAALRTALLAGMVEAKAKYFTRVTGLPAETIKDALTTSKGNI